MYDTKTKTFVFYTKDGSFIYSEPMYFDLVSIENIIKVNKTITIVDDEGFKNLIYTKHIVKIKEVK